MQTPGCLIRLARKLAARMQRAQDDLQSGFAGELGVRIGGNAASVVPDRDRVIRMQFHLDAIGMAGHGLVHRVVEHLCHKVVQGALIGAADIHARALAHRLEPFENLDRRGIIGGGGAPGEKIVGHRCCSISP